ncbi:MAG TPA: PAS domain S-box protein [Actinomycetota bacterium]|jgi:PAS domain S-box-containing protein|nr:PAS domain S-box protein [Actinomycetota bacterium]
MFPRAPTGATPTERAHRFAVRAAFAYALVASMWVVGLDIALHMLLEDPLARSVGIAKEAVFVLASTGVVWLCIRRFRREWQLAQGEVDAADDALRESEHRNRLLVERVPGVVWLNEVDRDDPKRTHCIYVAPQLEELLGYKPDEWMTDDDLWQRVIVEDDREAVLAASDVADETGVLSIEYRARRRDGGIVWIHDEAVLIPADSGRPSQWQGLMVDITPQRVQDAALHELTQSLGGVFSASPLGIIVIESDGRVRHWNPAAEQMFGWTAAEIVGQPLPYLPPDKKQEFADLMRRELAGERIAGFETTRMRKDGSRIDVSLSVAALRDADGEISGMLGVIEDISDRRQAEQDRRRALDRQLRLATRLELLHQVDRDVLAATSIDEMAGQALEHLRRLVPFDGGTVALVDAATGRLTSVAVRHFSDSLGPVPDSATDIPDDVVRELLSHDVLVTDDLQEVDTPTPSAAMARSVGVRSTLSVALKADEGQLGALMLSSMEPGVFDEEAADIASEVGSELAIAFRQALLRDALAERATQLEQLAQERQQMLHRIVRAQEEERERVALELHDGLGQLLTSISLFASDLELEVPPRARPRAVRVTELVRRAIADSRQLVWSLRPPELERLGLVPAVRRLAEDVSVPDVLVDLHEEIGELRLPPESEAVVYRVVQEAVHNAQKHARAEAISIVMRRNDGMLTTLVEDNGRGFDPASIQPGRGLGLIGMRERAELVEGRLVVESATGAGTRIRLEVPIKDAPNVTRTAVPGRVNA